MRTLYIYAGMFFYRNVYIWTADCHAFSIKSIIHKLNFKQRSNIFSVKSKGTLLRKANKVKIVVHK